MPQHKSAAKRVRQNIKRRYRNRQHRSQIRTLMRQLAEAEDKATAEALLKEVKSSLDSLTGKGIIHKNKAANYKSRFEKKVNAMS